MLVLLDTPFQQQPHHDSPLECTVCAPAFHPRNLTTLAGEAHSRLLEFLRQTASIFSMIFKIVESRVADVPFLQFVS